MKQEIISDKAQDYVSRLYSEGEYPIKMRDIEADVKEAFKTGAEWRVNSVWHDSRKEEPLNQELIIKEDIMGDYDMGCELRNDTVRWAYILDLIPNGEEERL